MYVVLGLSLIVYLWMIFSAKYRTAIAILGSGAILIYGSISKAFPVGTAFQKFPTEIVILIIVLSLYTKLFEISGFFDYLGEEFFKLSEGRKILLAVLLPTVIYATSLFMNNLSVILLFTFICLQLAVRMRLPIVPLLVSAIIASNIGGAPLPWADTPAVILTLYTDFNLYDFLTKLFIPCGIYNILLVIYTVIWFKKSDKADTNILQKEEKQPVQPKSHRTLQKPPIPPVPPHKHQHPSEQEHLDEDILSFLHNNLSSQYEEITTLQKSKVKEDQTQQNDGENETISESTLRLLRGIQPPKHGTNPPTHEGLIYLIWKRAKYDGDNKEEAFSKGTKKKNREIKSKQIKKNKAKTSKAGLNAILFALLILGICIAPFLNISIAYVALFFGGLALVLNKSHPEDILNSVAILDSIVFIAALFLIAGAMETSGILTTLVTSLLTLTGENPFVILLFIMLSAFVIATFLSAGPAAATVLPICQQLSHTSGGKLVYAALALGILAGSSMLPWSATGGPVMLGEVNRFLSKFKGSKAEIKRLRGIFDLKEYIKFSIPFSLIILFLSGIFLWVYLLLTKV